MRKHALVLGGSIGGLLAARVLSEAFDRVTIVDRDVFPSGAENRRGVPQGRHTHGLLSGGREILEQLFPGISDDLLRQGAVSGDLLRDTRWYVEGGMHLQFPSGLNAVLVSRALLEHNVRRRVLERANVSVLTGMVGDGLAFDRAAGAVAGVRCGDQTLEADLTVDATGRGSHAPQWLEQIGFEKAPEECIDIQIAYSTCAFRRRASDLGGDVAVICGLVPATGRAAAMLAQEGDRWLLTQAMYHSRGMPKSVPEYVEFARGLPTLDIYNVIANAEPLCEPFEARFPSNLRRRYERVARFPAGFLVIGDAISSFNPIYGQGMSVACIEARVLLETLRGGDDGLAARFFGAAARAVDSPWEIAVGADLRLPSTVGPRTAKTTILNWYVARVHRAARRDRHAALAFHRVANLLDAPPALLKPSIAARVLWRGFGAPTRN